MLSSRPRPSRPRTLLWGAALFTSFLLLAHPDVRGQDENRERLFGSQERNEEALIGILYDFKMTQQKEPSGESPETYAKIIDKFLAGGWDESTLNRYFRATKAVYTTQIFIPEASANVTPKAFGVEGVVQPRMIAVHYKGQVVPPHNGTYRFVGFADDFIAVAVNGKTVLAGGRMNVSSWKTSDPGGMKASNGNLINGDWLELKTDEPFDLDVLVGERPGGQFAAILLFEERGASYQMEGSHPILPVFQLAKMEIPVPPNPRDACPTAPPGAIWKAVP